MGPVITPQSKQRVESLIGVGERQGAKVLIDGRKAKIPKHDSGNFLKPTILDDVPAIWQTGAPERPDEEMPATYLLAADVFCPSCFAALRSVYVYGLCTPRPAAAACGSIRSPRSSQQDSGKYATVLRKVGGQWLIATDIWNSNK